MISKVLDGHDLNWYYYKRPMALMPEYSEDFTKKKRFYCSTRSGRLLSQVEIIYYFAVISQQTLHVIIIIF